MYSISAVRSAFVAFFSRELARLDVTYRWKIPTLEGFHPRGLTNYQRNLELKNHLHTQWNSSTAKQKLAKIIVSDWGGVRRNSSTTLQGYIDEIQTLHPKTPLRGVASYSKIFSIVKPSEFAIYDARVAACLNAVQINAKIRGGIAFNYIPGRNNITGNNVTKLGFSQRQEFSPQSLISSGWLRIEKDHTYEKYIELIMRCLEKLPGRNLYDLEMALFANAEVECERAMKNYIKTNRT